MRELHLRLPGLLHGQLGVRISCSKVQGHGHHDPSGGGANSATRAL